VSLFCCVLKCSFLGPLLFTLYTTSLSSLIHSHRLNYILYAEDTQVYIPLSTADTYISIKQLGDCLSDISGWMTCNKRSSLYAHPDNSAYLLISSLRTSLVIAPYHQTMYVIFVLHLIAILISENILVWHVAPAYIIFVTFAVFGAIFLFQSPKPLLQLSLLVGLITATFICITFHLRMIILNFIVFRIAYLAWFPCFL